MSAPNKSQIAMSNDDAGEAKLEDKLKGLNMEDKAGPEEEEPEAAGVEEDGQDKRAGKKTTTVPHDFMVPCVTKDNETVRVQLALMMQSETFAKMWENLKMLEATKEKLAEFTFPMATVSTPIFKKIVQWMEQHAGKPVPVFELDTNTRERKFFTFDEFEQQFFKVNFKELGDLTLAATYLDIKSLYLYGTQAAATVIKERPVEELIQILGLQNDLTEAELARKKAMNVWCLY